MRDGCVLLLRPPGIFDDVMTSIRSLHAPLYKTNLCFQYFYYYRMHSRSLTKPYHLDYGLKWACQPP